MVEQEVDQGPAGVPARPGVRSNIVHQPTRHKRRKKEQRRKMKVHKQDLLHLFSDLGYPTLVTEASLEIEVVRERVAVESQFVVQEAMTLVVATMHLMDGRVPCEVGGGMCVVEAVDTSR